MFVVKFSGGFANQLFQYSLYLKLTEIYPFIKIYADISHYNICKDHGGFKLGNFIPFHYLRRSIKKTILIDEETFFSNTFTTNNNYIFVGYWQDLKFMPKNLSPIKALFQKITLSEQNCKFLSKIKKTNSVSIHVRRGDYVKNYYHGNISNDSYYNNAISYIKNTIYSPFFFVFSDDIEWCKNHIALSINETIYITGNEKNVEVDLYLMSFCKCNILANSSFSWWAQFINENENKIVLTPEYWYNQPMKISKPIIPNSITIPNVPIDIENCNSPFFSIIIPVYNTSDYIRRCLTSVLNQKFMNIEVIIVDDGSSDCSLSILREYSFRDKRIILISHKENKGLLLARRTGIQAASGKYYLFLDSDDYLETNACEILYNEINKTYVDIIEFEYYREPQNFRITSVSDNSTGIERVKKYLNRELPCTIWNKAYKSDLIKKSLNELQEERLILGEDCYQTIVFSYYATSFITIHSPLLHYSINTGITTQITKSKSIIKSNIDDILTLKKLLKLFLLNKVKESSDMIDVFINKEIEILYNFCRKDNLTLYDQIDLLNYLDNSFNLNTANMFLTDISKSLKEYNSFLSSSVRRKIKKILKYFFKLLISRTGKQR